jgi:hypothetical protein
MSCDTFYARVDNKPHVFIRIEKHWFDIYGRSVRADGSRIDSNEGLIRNAVKVSEEEVAELVGQAEEYQERLARAEAALRQWVDFRRSRSRKGKRKLSLQKKVVASSK